MDGGLCYNLRKTQGAYKTMRNLLIVVDMQNDFIDGALGTAEAVSIVPAVKEKIAAFDGTVVYTRDSHLTDYLETREGKNLPVPHCIIGTNGWQISPKLTPNDNAVIFDKPTFGSTDLMEWAVKEHGADSFGKITLIGLCTDICVISNAMLLKAALPEVDITVDSACCAGVTPESHDNALTAMKMCQILVE
jgi:nicotinamidase-related amidase